ncbi:hypothetical protein DNTS_026838 [Danionella cerebrum]|uniref:Uncharacterized protein n=1 Tax=Danionella cerebrum TaxID=2873325 RepID=A0A553NJ15_9TELE|nr:hypothetical protein DNTS_026838 [Danionella translucida]
MILRNEWELRAASCVSKAGNRPAINMWGINLTHHLDENYTPDFRLQCAAFRTIPHDSPTVDVSASGEQPMSERLGRDVRGPVARVESSSRSQSSVSQLECVADSRSVESLSSHFGETLMVMVVSGY